MSTIKHSDTDRAPDSSALQISGQPTVDPVIEYTGHQGVPGVETIKSSPEGHKLLVIECADIVTNKSEHIEQSPTFEAVLDNGVLPSAAQISPEEPDADVEHILSPELSQTNPIFDQEASLIFISLECSQPHHFEDNLTLVVMLDGDIYQTLHVVKASPAVWNTVDNIDLSALAHATDITLCLQSSNENDEAFYTITADEMFATMSAEQGTTVEYAFTYLNEENSVGVKMVSTLNFNQPLSLMEDLYNRMKAKQILKEIKERTASLSFEETENIDKITQVIRLYETLLSDYASQFDSSSNAILFFGLGTTYMWRFEPTENIQDIGFAISYLQKAVQSTPSHHSRLPLHCDKLGNAYMCRFQCSGNIQDIKHAITYLQKAVESTASDSVNLHSRLVKLGRAYTYHIEQTGNSQHIEDAISYLRGAIQSTPSDSSEFFALCNSLGLAYICCFKQTANNQDIEHAISYFQNAIQSTPSNSSDFPSCCSNLGTAYKCRFEQTRNSQDIEQAISYQQNALQNAPSNHFNISSLFSNLGMTYLCCFKHTEDNQDIEHAIFYFQKAVQSPSLDVSHFSAQCSNLGAAYVYQFQRTGNSQDIEQAILYLQKALQSTPLGFSMIASLYGNLGTAYMRCFEQTRNSKDIEHAILYLEKAVQSAPSDLSTLSSNCNNLGISYIHQFECTGNIQDIINGIFHFQQSLQYTPADSPYLPSRHSNLANAYIVRFNHLQDNSDARHSLHLFATGAVANGPPSIRLACARTAALVTLQHSPSFDYTQCLSYFSIAIDLLAEVAGLEQTIHHRYMNINKYSGFVCQAVVTGLAADRVDLALEWLEQGRCLVWNQLGQLRTPIDELMIRNHDLADRFRKAATALESDGSRPLTSHYTPLNTLSWEIQQQDKSFSHSRHATEYKQLLNEIRELPNLHSFLKPRQCASIISSIPTDGPIVILHAANPMCSALALIAGAEEPILIPLNNFSLDNAEKLQNMLQSDVLHYREVEEGERLSGRRRDRKSMSDILNELWSKVVHPILKALAFSVPPLSSDRPRIWWCPTGPFAFLPLHAAGIYGLEAKPGSCVSDFVVSSYTPTVGSVSEKFAASAMPSSNTRLLLVSQPHTPGLSAIPSTTIETYAVETMMKEEQHVNTLLLENSEATVDRVKSKMASNSWVHFACHGIQAREDPLKSGVQLHDGRLGLLEIIRQKLPTPEFAFLSACQTSTGDLVLSDEVVHLAAGMLASGYRGVVSTMWSISDHYGPEFAKYFYQYLLNNMGTCGLDSTRAAYALDDATRRVREKLGDNESSLLTWVPYVHFGY